MPIFRPHPDIEGAYYLKRLPSEPRFEALSGVAVTVDVDKSYVRGLGPQGTETVQLKIRARDLGDAAIAAANVVVSLTPTFASTIVPPAVEPIITIGPVTAASPAQEGGEYVFDCTLTCKVDDAYGDAPETTGTLLQGVRATVTSDASRYGIGSASFYYITTRPGTVTTFSAVPWIRGVKLTWETPEATVGDAVISNAALSFFLIRMTAIPTPGLTTSEALQLIRSAGIPDIDPGSVPARLVGLSPRVFAVTGNSFVDANVSPDPQHYWLVSQDLFGNLSSVAGPESATPGYIGDSDFIQGSIDIATVAAEDSVANALAAGSVTTTKLGVLNVAFDPSKFSFNTGTISWTALTLVAGGTVYGPYTGSTTDDVIFAKWNGSNNFTVIGRPRWDGVGASAPAGTFEADFVDGEDLLLGFNTGTSFRPAFTGTVISGDYLKTREITADKIEVNELSALTANLGRVTTGIIWNSATNPTAVIRLSATTGLGMAQNTSGQPVLGTTTPGGTVQVASGVAVFSTSPGSLKPGDVIIASGVGVPYTVTSEPTGLQYNVVPNNVSTSGAVSYSIRRLVYRLVDLAASEGGITPGAENRRFLSVVGQDGKDRIFISASGEAKFTGVLETANLLIDATAGQTASGLTVNLPSTFNADVAALGTFNLNVANISTANITALLVQSGTNPLEQVLLGQYNLAPAGGVVADNTAYGFGGDSEVVSQNYDAVSAPFAFSLSTQVGGQDVPPYNGSYAIRMLPKVLVPPTIDPGVARPYPKITMVVERKLATETVWSTVATRTVSVNVPYGEVIDYGFGYEDIKIVGYNLGGDEPGRELHVSGNHELYVYRTAIPGNGLVSTSGGTATFTVSQTLAADDWFTAGGFNFKVVSGSGTSYTVLQSVTVTNETFSTYDYSTSFSIPGTPYDPANAPSFRVRVQGQNLYDTYWDVDTPSGDMVLPEITYTIEDTPTSIYFQYISGTNPVSRESSVAVLGGFLYLEPKTSEPAEGLAGEIIMRDLGSSIVPQYYNGISWVPLGGGTSGGVSVNGNPDITALTFQGSAISSIVPSGNSVTITIDSSGSSVTSLGGASGVITLGPNLTMISGTLGLSNVLTTSNFNTYVPALDGTGASGNWNINAATVTNGVYTSRQLTINATANQTSVTGGTQNLSADRTWTVGLASDVDIASTLDVGSVGALSATGVIARIGGGLRVGGTIYANDFVLEGGFGGGTGLSLNSLDDVTIAGDPPGIALASGQVLQYDGSVWRNVAASFGSNLVVQEEGVNQTAAATTLNFTGANVTASAVGGVVTIAVSGSPDAHTHVIADVTGLQTALDGKSAVGHTHVITDVTGLQTALDGKSAVGHTHAIADITGLQTALDGKVPTSRLVSSGAGLTGGGNLTADRTLALTGQALALHNLAANGIVTRTASGAFSARSIAVSGSVLTVTDGNGVAGNPTLGITTTNITSVGTLTALSVTGDITAGGTIYATDFVLTGGGGGGGTGLSLNSLDDVDTSGAYVPSDEQVLTFDTAVGGGTWIPKTFSTQLSVQSNGSAVASRQTLNFISGSNATVSVVDDGANNRVNVTVNATGAVSSVFGRTGAIAAQEGDYTLDLLGGVTISVSPSGKVLRHNGTAWVDTLLAAADIPTLTASKISDFNTAVRTNRLDQMAAPTAAVSFNSQNITGVGTITATSFSGALAGNASTATALSSNRTFALTGDITGSVSNNLSSGFSIATTLANTTVTANSYGSASSVATFTVDGKGRLTAASAVAIAISSAAVSGLAASATTDTTNAGNISSGILLPARLSGSYTGITTVGTLTALSVTGDITAGGTIYASDFVLTGGAGGGGTGLSLDSLDDVITTGAYIPTDEQVLVYDTAVSGGTWIPKTLVTTLAVQNNGSAVGSPRNTLNLIPGTGITLNTSDDGTKVNVTINSQLSGTVQVAQGGTGATTASGARTNLGATTVGSNLFTLTNPSAVTFLQVNANNTVTALNAASFRSAIGAGTVTSVAGTGTVSGLTLSGTVTSSGNLTLGGTLAVAASNFSSQTANTFLAAPNGAAGVPTFRAIVAADIPTLNQNTTGTASNVTGTVAVANGGTGATTASAARTNLGLAIGSSVQAWDPDLDAISALVGTSGFLKKTAANTWTLDTNTYLTGNQSITFTGDVTGSGTTSVTLSIAAGVIVNADISASAAIAYSKLALSNSIVNADISTSAAIADSKLATISTAGKVDAGAVSAGTFGLGAYIVRNASTQDGVRLAGRAGGTSSYYVTITPTTLSANRTLTLANGNTTLVSGTMVPTTGSGATGSWGISITGSAASLTTTYTIWGQNFNGTGNVTGALSGATTGSFSGNVTAADFVLGSDRRLKADLVPLAGSLDALDRLEAYRYRHLRHNQVEVGVIAQELQDVLPEAVSEMEDGMLGVTYDRLVPFLLSAVKELKARVVQLERGNTE